MMARKGKIGGASIITQDEVNYNCNENVIRLTIREPEKYNPYYVTTFFNSNYGLQQIKRLSTGNVQPWVSIYQLKKLKCIVLNSGFQAMIETRIQEAHNILKESQRHYTTAQQILQSAIHFETSSLSHENVTVKSFSEAFSTGRLEAEYFMPKYDDILAHLHTFNTTTIPEEYYFYKNAGTNYAEDVKDIGVIKTKQLTNRGVNEEGIESWFAEESCSDSVFLKKGDIVFASMGVGSFGKVSIFTYEGDKRFVTDSTLRIYRAKDNTRVLPEVLCLFLQSDIGHDMIYRYVVGSTGIINIYDRDIASIPIPILDRETQNTIAGHVRESFSLRMKSERLINIAVKSVELAIESNEESAMNFITKETGTK